MKVTKYMLIHPAVSISIIFFVQVVLLPLEPDVKVEWSSALSSNRLSTVDCNLNLVGLVCVFVGEVAPPCLFFNRKFRFTQLGHFH